MQKPAVAHIRTVLHVALHCSGNPVYPMITATIRPWCHCLIDWRNRKISKSLFVFREIHCLPAGSCVLRLKSCRFTIFIGLLHRIHRANLTNAHIATKNLSYRFKLFLFKYNSFHKYRFCSQKPVFSLEPVISTITNLFKSMLPVLLLIMLPVVTLQRCRILNGFINLKKYRDLKLCFGLALFLLDKRINSPSALPENAVMQMTQQ